MKRGRSSNVKASHQVQPRAAEVQRLALQTALQQAGSLAASRRPPRRQGCRCESTTNSGKIATFSHLIGRLFRRTFQNRGIEAQLSLDFTTRFVAHQGVAAGLLPPCRILRSGLWGSSESAARAWRSTVRRGYLCVVAASPASRRREAVRTERALRRNRAQQTPNGARPFFPGQHPRGSP
jgi:hypothetical protein